jgi:hypothetical protein
VAPERRGSEPLLSNLLYHDGGVSNVTISWYPKNIIVGLILLGAFAVVLNTAVSVSQGVLVGIGAAVVYALVDVFLSVNPAVWRRRDQAPKNL